MKWTEIPASVVLAAAELCDGHTIFAPEAFVEINVPQELIARCTDVYESNLSDPKYTISGPDGKPVNQLKGIYGLDALAGMIRDFKLPARGQLGRGSQAEVWKQALREHFAQTAQTDAHVTP